MFGGNDAGQVITPYQAQHLTYLFWPMEERALATNDAAATDMIESGPAAEIADAISCENQKLGKNIRVARPETAINVYVPHQTEYPARFVAEVQTVVYPSAIAEAPPGTQYLEFLVFVRSDRKSSWKAVIDTGAAAVPGADGHSTVPGTNLDVDAPRPLWIDPANVPQALASYWQRWFNVGVPPVDNPFAPGRWTNEQGQVIETGKLTELERGIVDHTSYYTDTSHDGLYQFAVNDGDSYDVTCFTVRYRSTLTPANTGLLYQDATRSHYGGHLQPGSYSSITILGLHQSCAYIPMTQPQSAAVGGPGIGVLGGQGGEVDVTGVPGL